MPDDRLPANLAFACSHFPSIAEVCRRIGVNRQQFNKYLAGQVRPSKHNMRRICDFFGVTEAELLLEEHRFAALLAIKRRPAAEQTPPPHLRGLKALRRASGDLSRYVGCYYRYFYTFGHPGRITRSFGVLARSGESYFWKNIELFRDTPFGRRQVVSKYEGVAFLVGDRISILEYDALMSSSITQLVLYPSYKPGIGYLVGVQTGGSIRRGRKPAASAVLLEYLGPEVDARRALARCGLFAEEAIDPDIRALIRNEIPAGAYVFEVDEA